MKKFIKIFLIIFVMLVIIVLADTIQAKFLNNRPILKITENSSYGKNMFHQKRILI